MFLHVWILESTYTGIDGGSMYVVQLPGNILMGTRADKTDRK